MTKERGSDPHRKAEGPFRIDAIAKALGSSAELVAEDTYELVLRNEPLRLTLRLGLQPEKGQVNIYLRGQSAFLGMLVAWGVTHVDVQDEEGRVDFISRRGKSELRLSLLSTGHFFMDNTAPRPDAPPSVVASRRRDTGFDQTQEGRDRDPAAR